MKVFVGGEYSGIIRDAFIRKGHEAVSCDFLDTEKAGPHYKGDLFDLIDYPWDLAIFHPPCTDTAVSGAKHFEQKKLDGRQYKSVAFFMQIVRRSEHIPRVCIEHPVSIMSSLWRKPDQVIQPWQFGHGETIATCLFLKGLPVLKPTKIVDGREPKVHFMPPGPERWKDRSRTYAGIGEAMADQWGSEGI
jgi:hypothetical protein